MSYFNSVGFIDTSGSSHYYKNADGKPRISAMPYVYDVAEGNIAGHESWTKIGYTSAMGTTESDLWSKTGTYVFPTSASRMAVSSSNNTQDTSTGTGAQKVTIYYLDGDYNSQTEEVTLSGSTLVSTSASNILRVNAFRVTAAGTSGSPLGNISLTHTSGSPAYSYITAGYTRARNSAYTVPAGKSLYLLGGLFGFGYAANQTHYCRMYVRITQNGLARTPGLFYGQTDIIVANNSQFFEFAVPQKIVEKVDLKVSGVSSFTGIASSTLSGWLETN